MATTSIWRVKGYLNQVLLYAENPNKTSNPQKLSVPDGQNLDSLEDVISYTARENATEQRRFVSAWNTTPETAREDMMNTKCQFDKLGGTIAYHGYQSFAEGEVTPELAHEIGKQLAKELWGDRYEVLIATHVDKQSHIHNHFVVNTVSFVDGIKFHRTKEDYQRMREVSDRLCREYGLSVIREPKGRKKNYAEWSAEKNGKPTQRGQIKKDIDRAIAASLTEREFFESLTEMGYEFKFYAESGKLLERPSLRPKGAERFFRFDRLGENYSLDEINDRILENIRREVPFPEEEQEAVRRYRRDNPPKTKAKGIARLYYYYCYELKIIVRWPASTPQISQYVRQELLKLDKLDRQVLFLTENGIETIDDLNDYRTIATEEIDSLKQEKTDLRNKLRRTQRSANEEMAISLKQDIAAVTNRITRLQESLETCNDVERRSARIQAELADIQNQNYEKEEQSNEQLLGRSGRTGRENDAERR